MEAVAHTKYIRISPKKIRFLGNALKGLSPIEARDRLMLRSEKAARILSDAIKTAQYNAINNLKLSSDNLRIKTIETGKGPFLKRWQPVSRGIAHQIKKRTSHIKVTLEEIQKKEQQKEIRPERKKDEMKGDK